jgi:hypothetical protein
VHARTEDGSNYTKDYFYKEIERVFGKVPKYHVEILLGDFNEKLGILNIIKLTNTNKNLHEIISDNGVRVVNFAT